MEEKAPNNSNRVWKKKQEKKTKKKNQLEHTKWNEMEQTKAKERRLESNYVFAFTTAWKYIACSSCDDD